MTPSKWKPSDVLPKRANGTIDCRIVGQWFVTTNREHDVKSRAGISAADIGVGRRPAADEVHPVVVGQAHRLLVDQLYIDSPTPDTDIIDSGALDAFALVELLVKLEEHVDVEVPVEDLYVDDFRSARRIAHVVASLNGRDPQHQ